MHYSMVMDEEKIQRNFWLYRKLNDRLNEIIRVINEPSRRQPGRKIGPSEVGILALELLLDRSDDEIRQLLASRRAVGVLGVNEQNANEIVDAAQEKALRRKKRKRDGSTIK